MRSRAVGTFCATWFEIQKSKRKAAITQESISSCPHRSSTNWASIGEIHGAGSTAYRSTMRPDFKRATGYGHHCASNPSLWMTGEVGSTNAFDGLCPLKM
jgi:hypothetical protein